MYIKVRYSNDEEARKAMKRDRRYWRKIDGYIEPGGCGGARNAVRTNPSFDGMEINSQYEKLLPKHLGSDRFIFASYSINQSLSCVWAKIIETFWYRESAIAGSFV